MVNCIYTDFLLGGWSFEMVGYERRAERTPSPGSVKKDLKKKKEHSRKKKKKGGKASSLDEEERRTPLDVESNMHIGQRAIKARRRNSSLEAVSRSERWAPPNASGRRSCSSSQKRRSNHA